MRELAGLLVLLYSLSRLTAAFVSTRETEFSPGPWGSVTCDVTESLRALKASVTFQRSIEDGKSEGLTISDHTKEAFWVVPFPAQEAASERCALDCVVDSIIYDFRNAFIVGPCPHVAHFDSLCSGDPGSDVSRAGLRCFWNDWWLDVWSPAMQCMLSSCSSHQEERYFQLVEAAQEDPVSASENFQSLKRFHEHYRGWYNSRVFKKYRPPGILLPIWVPRDRDEFDYNAPEEYLSPVDGRTVQSYGKSIPTTVTASLAAYVTTLGILSSSPGYVAELVQGIFFLFFPVLPAIQLVSNLFSTLSNPYLTIAHAKRYNLSGICGSYASTASGKPLRWHERRRLSQADPLSFHAVQRPRQNTARSIAALLALLVTLTLGVLTFVMYCKRLGFRHESAMYIATLGLDHRLGWLGFGAIISALTGVVAHFSRRHVAIETAVYPLNDDNLWDDGNIWTEFLVAVFVQDFLSGLCGRHHLLGWLMHLVASKWFIFALGIFATLAARLWFRLSRLWTRRRRGVKKLFVVFVVVLSMAVAALQIFQDMVEALEVQHGIVHPWNYAWKEKDPDWPSF